VHRVKIEVLRDFTATHQGQILYLDTDVVFTRPVTEIFEQLAEGKLYMHVMEGYVHHSDNTVFRKLSGFFRQTAVTVHNVPVAIPEKATMWNAGVLGFHSRYAYLLDEVLAFTDEVYRQFPKHVVEQFAFSLHFQQTAPLLSAHTSIYHYWNLKELRPVLASFFAHFRDKNWDGLVYYSRLIQLPDYLQQKANFYYNRSTLQKLLKRKWKATIPDWNLLLQQL
jgi:lipopolysaccharide biosynthesis glycosyltransferase